MTDTLALRMLPGGEYVAYGSYSLADDPTSRRPLESFFTLFHEELLLVFEGSFARPDGPKHGFKLEVELPAKEAGKGYFVFQYQANTEIKGVVGTTEAALLLAGRSKDPAMQLAAHLTFIDEYHMSMQGLVAFEDFQWVTWSISVKAYDPQLAKSSVMSLPKRA
jgi:hypothetical protein